MHLSLDRVLCHHYSLPHLKQNEGRNISSVSVPGDLREDEPQKLLCWLEKVQQTLLQILLRAQVVGGCPEVRAANEGPAAKFSQLG